MLYPKNSSPLSQELFQNPTCEYRGTPFWAWNNKLDAKELCWQIEQFKKMGFGGFHMHVRTGMATDYLSDEYMEIIGACVDKAKKENMLAWLYDEDRWPSGAAGGIVTKDKRYRAKHLLLTRIPYGEIQDNAKAAYTRVSSNRTENGVLLAVYDIELNKKGELSGYNRIKESDAAKGFKLFIYEETALPDPWYNNETYLNTLDPASVSEFIKVTYDRYKETISESFGNTVPAMFTDEPQFSRKQTLNFAHEQCDVILPWTFDLPDTYKAVYSTDILDNLPELLWSLPDGKVSITRYRYHDHIAERFAAAFADLCGTWCEEHGIMLTGHMMEEPTLESQTAALGEAMRSYRSFQLPGIDMLCDRREFTTAKQAQSAARQYGRPGVMSELYGVTNWDFDFRGHKLQGDWQAALGVTVRVPHLSWVSMNGEAKRDYPSTFNYQSPWYEEYPYIEDHFSRINTVMTRGKAVCRVGVIHPIESYWLYWGDKETTAVVRDQMDKDFEDITQWLLRGLIDFDFISESLLPGLCEETDISGEGFPVGDMCYETVVVPALITMRSTTFERLEGFAKKGGKIIFMGKAPTLIDAAEDSRAEDLWKKSLHIPFERLPLLDALEDLRELEIRDSSGIPANNFLYQLREEETCRWLFIAQADKPENPDIPGGEEYRIILPGHYSVNIYDSMTGTINPYDINNNAGHTEFRYLLYEHDSLLLRLDPPAENPEKCSILTHEIDNEVLRYLHPVPVTLSEPNVMLLDIAEFSLDNEEYRTKEEILRLDNILRKELGWPPRGNSVAQPWVEKDTSTPHTLRLRYKFNSEIEIEGAELALENAVNTTVALNGQKAGAVEGYYVDKCIGKVKLPSIKAGENVIELTIPYGKKTDVEACYLLGDFGVKTVGCVSTLISAVKELYFGDIVNQGLPFYGGNLTYHLDVEKECDTLAVAAEYYRGHLLKVSVDGKDEGVIAFSPYRIIAGNLAPGKHKVDITYFGSRVNTFGQLHRNDRFNQWWGPDSWRTNGAAWSYEYRFWPQGVLKSPEIMIL